MLWIVDGLLRGPAEQEEAEQATHVKASTNRSQQPSGPSWGDAGVTELILVRGRSCPKRSVRWLSVTWLGIAPALFISTSTSHTVDPQQALPTTSDGNIPKCGEVRVHPLSLILRFMPSTISSSTDLLFTIGGEERHQRNRTSTQSRIQRVPSTFQRTRPTHAR